MKAGQERTQAELAKILERQNEALERAKEQAESQRLLAAAAEAQTAALQAVADRAEQQLKQVEAAVAAGLVNEQVRPWEWVL